MEKQLKDKVSKNENCEMKSWCSLKGMRSMAKSHGFNKPTECKQNESKSKKEDKKKEADKKDDDKKKDDKKSSSGSSSSSTFEKKA